MIQRKKKLLVNSIMLLTIALSALIIGCGRTPPEGFWSWSKEDSSAVQTIVNEWRTIFTTSFEDTVFPIITRADTIRIAIRQDIRNLWMRPHYWPASIARTITNYQMVDSFIPSLDTTIMVRLTERISGTIRIRMDSCTIKLADTVVGGDTYPLYSRYFVSSLDTVLEKSFQGTSYRYLHFERDTVTKAWKFTKMSGGARYFVPSEADAPYLSSCTLRTRTKSVGILLRPDTTKYGVQRLYYLSQFYSDSTKDTIMSFSVNDTLTAKIMSYDPPIVFGFLHHKKKRYDLNLLRPITPQSTTRVLPLTSGWDQIMFEFVPYEALCKQGNYSGLFWILPMKLY